MSNYCILFRVAKGSSHQWPFSPSAYAYYIDIEHSVTSPLAWVWIYWFLMLTPIRALYVFISYTFVWHCSEVSVKFLLNMLLLVSHCSLRIGTVLRSWWRLGLFQGRNSACSHRKSSTIAPFLHIFRFFFHHLSPNHNLLPCWWMLDYSKLPGTPDWGFKQHHLENYLMAKILNKKHRNMECQNNDKASDNRLNFINTYGSHLVWLRKHTMF